jgi:hypothetical protein
VRSLPKPVGHCLPTAPAGHHPLARRDCPMNLGSVSRVPLSRAAASGWRTRSARARLPAVRGR